LLEIRPEIEEAAVYLTPDEQGQKKITATLITKDNVIITESELLQDLANYLPKYALPSVILFKKTIPRTSNGKIDYQKLQQSIL
jgi:fatty-acyl-CoA synthase